MRVLDQAAAPTTERRNLEDIASFFGRGPTSSLIQELTGVSRSSLSRVANGETRRTENWEHVATLAAYVRDLRELLTDASGGQTEPEGDMSSWLVTGYIQTSRGRKRAKEVLSDPALAQEALAGLRRISR